MIKHIEDNDGFTLDELLESIVAEKIFNINEDKILTRLASAIKLKFSTVYDNTSTNIFVRASLADSTYKSQSNILFTTRSVRNEVNSSRPRIPQKPTILNWFKRDASKTVEKKEVKQECVYTEEQPSSNIIPVDIDPFGTLVITGEMLAFSSDDESNLDTERTHLKDVKPSSAANARYAADEDDETCLDDNSLNNWSTDDCSQSSKSVDFDVADGVADSNNQLDEKGFSPMDINSATNVDVAAKDDYKGKENVIYLGNNIIVLHGSGNNASGCYWLLSKVFDCEFKTLITNTYQENEFIIIQNKKVQHIDCTVLKTQLSDELIPVEKVKDILLNRHSQVCVLEHFDHLGKNWQILMSKWFNKVYEKLFIILCCNVNYVDFRVRSYSLVLRLNGLDRDRFIDHAHKIYVMNANRNRYCLSRLNVIEIANRVDFDLILFFNTLVDAQRNYMNAIRKHRTRQSHKWLRSLIHIILHNSRNFSSLKSSLITDTIAEYGVHELDLMLIDFYNRLMEMGSLELEPLKPDINRLISNMFVDKPLDDDLTDLEAKICCMKFLVYDLICLIQDSRLSRAS
ncbi:conserved hypothetical protein [Theileria orientalis strain Shintoku]|uniref:Uncharacterized protein n=1 Tax=Theileria orientalis strain Shintoku TaxID=869250 RepID=J4C3R6_THEOR|nr:conserved hypothetical protein [Theileria orientalis strain Shintoku]BAM40906.1 conserved hypothetical protein [Theileria orientalis strain Shintoku]|eukprot:XP_009691207.1 conserved hypothetical protein [Theileria orientalis strain Shintoku]